MKKHNISKIEKLLEKGVKIPNPDSVCIGDEVNTEKISGDGVVIHSGCKIFGSSTLILQGARLGYEAPVTVENCQVGPMVDLKGGFFKEAVFLKKVSIGSGAHVRAGTILEEEARVAHTVGLKQTILFPYVTLGSLINFCDCLMSGGTGNKDHSEVGSSYIHFNYSPNQDKATPSLLGNVPDGVMLNQMPIFLGGQGGLVGPCRLAFGTIIAAGSIYRKDELRPGRLLFTGGGKGGNIRFSPGMYRNIKRIVANNIIYIANLIALMQWYLHVRSQFVSNDFPKDLFDGLTNTLKMALDERIKRLVELCIKMPDSARTYKNIAKENASSLLLQQKKELYDSWPELEGLFKEQLHNGGDQSSRDIFLEKIYLGIRKSGKDYISVIKGLEREEAETGTLWLKGIVECITDNTLKIIPLFK